MIFASLDLNEKSFEEVLGSFTEIKKSKFDGVEICLWQDMNEHASRIRKGLEDAGLYSNVHNDLMRIGDGPDGCRKKLSSSLEFKKRINGIKFISHPIKPYQSNLDLSKKIFDEFEEDILIENVKDIRMPELFLLDRHMVLDIGNLLKNRDYDNLSRYNLVEWLHVHDILNGEDHLPLGEGGVDLHLLMKKFQETGCTIELGSIFRRWDDLKRGYIKSIDCLNNSKISCRSYGKNVRLKHLLNLVGNKTVEKAFEIGCGNGYLVHNVPAKSKRGYDLNPSSVFNDVSYFQHDIRRPLLDHADLIICSEVLEHVQDDVNAIKNLYSALNPGGKIFLSTINKNTLEDKSEIDKDRGHLRRYGLELKRIMEKEGFSTQKFYPIRSRHYYQSRGSIEKYSIEEDIKSGAQNASGWIYFGGKE